MSASNRHRRFTVYDMMEAKGLFESNPANQDSRSADGLPLYTGPVQYPKMFYSPKGEERITVPAEIIVTPLGPKSVGEQRELISELALTPEDEARLRASGWHDHPAKAMKAAGKNAPAMSSDSRIADLEAQIAKLQLERNDETAKRLSETRPTGAKPAKPPSDDPFTAPT